MTGSNESLPEMVNFELEMEMQMEMQVCLRKRHDDNQGRVRGCRVEWGESDGTYNVQAQTQENRNDTCKGLKLGLKCKLVPPDFTRPM